MDPERRDKLLKVLLRSLPFSVIPGPELLDLYRDINRDRGDLSSKVTKASEALHNASRLVSELETTLNERAERLDKVREEVERLSALSQVELEKAAPLLKELDAALGKGRVRERWIALGINLVAGLALFFFGVLVGPRLFPQAQPAAMAPLTNPATPPSDGKSSK
jgi:hypothetical protein